MKACDEQLVGGQHVEHSFASSDSLVLVVVHFEMPFRAWHGNHVLRARVGGDHDSFAIAFNVEGKQSGRMAGSIDRCNAGNDFVVWLDKCRPVDKGQASLYKYLPIEFPSLSDVFTALPKIEFRGAEDILCIRKNWFPALREPADMIGMSVRNDNDVDVFGLVPGAGQALGGLSRRQTLAELLVFARQCAIARVEQNELLSRIHERRNVRMLKSLCVDIVCACEGMHRVCVGVGAVVGMQPISDGLRVQNRCDLEAAELEAINCRLQFASERCCPLDLLPFITL